mmetsp:Transcript_49589/g.108298  ORF Transcript_49589/g.108298 Transcript_49589/m.108298 type:complete len:445 (+) Transcript_49589:1478-2812(+)
MALREVQERLCGLGGAATVAIPSRCLQLTVGRREIIHGAFPAQEVTRIGSLVHVNSQTHECLRRPGHPLVGRDQLLGLKAVGVAGRPALGRGQAQPRGLQAQPLVHRQPLAMALRPAAPLVTLVRAQVRANTRQHIGGGDHPSGCRGASGVVAQSIGGLTVAGAADLPQCLHGSGRSQVQLLITIAHGVLEHILRIPQVHLHHIGRQSKVEHQAILGGHLRGSESVLMAEPVVRPGGEFETERLVASRCLITGARVGGTHGSHDIGRERNHVPIAAVVRLDLQQVQGSRVEIDEPRVHPGIHGTVRIGPRDPAAQTGHTAIQINGRLHGSVLAHVDVRNRRWNTTGHLARQRRIEKLGDVHGANEVVLVGGAVLIHSTVDNMEKSACGGLHHLTELDEDLRVDNHILLPVVRHGVQHLGDGIGGQGHGPRIRVCGVQLKDLIAI